MSCDGCKAKDVGACTAHGGTGWDPRTGKTPCPHAPQMRKAMTTVTPFGTIAGDVIGS